MQPFLWNVLFIMNKSLPVKQKLLRNRNIWDSIFATAGVMCATVGLKGFLLPNQILDGGVTGLSLLCNYLTSINISILIILINLPFIWLAYRQITRILAVKALLSIAALSIAVHFITLPAFTHDNLLISIFGGVFLGAGIGFSIRAGTVIDGTEIVAIYLSKKFRTTIGTVILFLNVLIFMIAAMVINFEVALYSILTYMSASKTANLIIHGIEEYIGVTIISLRSEEIRQVITEDLGYGVTIYSGKKGYRRNKNESHEIDIVHTIITRLELNRLHAVVENIDPRAFIIEYNINDTKGGMIKRISR